MTNPLAKCRPSSQHGAVSTALVLPVPLPSYERDHDGPRQYIQLTCTIPGKCYLISRNSLPTASSTSTPNTTSSSSKRSIQNASSASRVQSIQKISSSSTPQDTQPPAMCRSTRDSAIPRVRKVAAFPSPRRDHVGSFQAKRIQQYLSLRVPARRSEAAPKEFPRHDSKRPHARGSAVSVRLDARPCPHCTQRR